MVLIHHLCGSMGKDAAHALLTPRSCPYPGSLKEHQRGRSHWGCGTRGFAPVHAEGLQGPE